MLGVLVRNGLVVYVVQRAARLADAQEASISLPVWEMLPPISSTMTASFRSPCRRRMRNCMLASGRLAGLTGTVVWRQRRRRRVSLVDCVVLGAQKLEL